VLEASKVYSFKKDNQTYTLYVDSVRRRNEYWLEIKYRDGVIENTDRVNSWSEAVALLECHNWAAYEQDSMDLSFFDLILEAKGNNPARNYNAQQRLLEILKRLQGNEIIKVQNAEQEFDVGKHQIQRDIKAINEIFYQYSNKQVDYNRSQKGYGLNTTGDFFTIDDALIVLLFLFGTRALNKEELQTFSNKLIGLFSQAEQIKLRTFFQSYFYYYKPVQEQALFELFYTCFQAISEKRILKFTYTNNKGETKVHEVLPFTITYHDRKFYLHARVKGFEDQDPRAWLLDRIKDCNITNKKFTISESFKVGDYIQKAVNMYGGELQKVKLKVRDSNIEFLKRNFPEVIITPSFDEQWFNVELEVLGFMGIKLWILQQGPCVEVLEPIELREEVKELIQEMHQIYFKS
jgi:predicted DNA-binding transcriptional regulator YafY